jgi:hypothetical protein
MAYWYHVEPGKPVLRAVVPLVRIEGEWRVCLLEARRE